MAYLLDSGILLRLANSLDRQHALIRTTIGRLGNWGEQLFMTTQNVAEFCNVVTRPVVNNGLGRSPEEAVTALQRDVEPICSVLGESEAVYGELKRLVSTYAIVGKQIHDARLVAMMLVWQIENVLTLNDRDFRRYEPEGIVVVTPDSI